MRNPSTYILAKGLCMIVLVSLIVLLRELLVSTIFRMVRPYISFHDFYTCSTIMCNPSIHIQHRVVHDCAGILDGIAKGISLLSRFFTWCIPSLHPNSGMIFALGAIGTD